VSRIGQVVWVSGPVVRASLTEMPQVMEQVEIGHERLVGEVMGIDRDVATIQVYEETAGVRPGDDLYRNGRPLSVELGPGLLGRIFDGIQRPLVSLAELSGDFIRRGVSAPPLPRDRKWAFEPAVQVGQQAKAGQVIGTVRETALVEHRVMLPPGLSGTISWAAAPGEYTVDAPVARIDTAQGGRDLTMMQIWPVRLKRPVAERLQPDKPLVTGQRVLDTLFPLAKGGTAAVPGGFGAGKTMLQHALAKWSDADIVVYIGCGERGNEMTDVLTHFPKIVDPETGRSLMERTILIANTSNMPVAAREASIYTGITLAEYYRDMGYDVALMADSTSRWAEALREVSGRLEEMPAEEGFPAYLPSRLASFYERAGHVRTLGGQRGSVTIVGAVSPPGGDFSEPVTQHTRRFVRTYWALDKALASSRHFPAVNWLDSYSGYIENVANWWAQQSAGKWASLRQEVMSVLQQEAELEEIVRLVGPDTLPDSQRYLLFVARLVKQAFLQQNALDPVDGYSPPSKQIAMLETLMYVYHRGNEMIELGVPSYRLQNEIDVWPRLIRAKTGIPNENLSGFDGLRSDIGEQMERIRQEYVR